MTASVQIQCDGYPFDSPTGCDFTRGDQDRGYPTVSETRSVLAQEGWAYRIGRDLCPGCVKRLDASRVQERKPPPSSTALLRALRSNGVILTRRLGAPLAVAVGATGRGTVHRRDDGWHVIINGADIGTWSRQAGAAYGVVLFVAPAVASTVMKEATCG